VVLVVVLVVVVVVVVVVKILPKNTLINMKPKVMHTNPQRHVYIYRSYQNTHK